MIFSFHVPPGEGLNVEAAQAYVESVNLRRPVKEWDRDYAVNAAAAAFCRFELCSGDAVGQLVVTNVERLLLIWAAATLGEGTTRSMAKDLRTEVLAEGRAKADSILRP